MKKTNLKRILASLLSILMLLSGFAVVSSAKFEAKKAVFDLKQDSIGNFGSFFDMLSDEDQYVYDVDDYVTQYKIEKSTTKNPDGTTETTTYKYDSAGRMIEMAETQKSILGIKTFSSKSSRAFDKKGNLTEKTDSTNYGLLGGKEKYTISYSYAKNGFVTKEAGKSSVGKDNFSYKYDKKGNLVSVQGNGYSKSNTYDKNGRLIKSVEVFKMGKETSKCVTKHTYDSKGRLLKETRSESGKDGFNESNTFSYDKKGNVTKLVYRYEDEDGVEKTIETYTYDSRGNITKYVSVDVDIDGEKSKSSATFAYDKKDRVIKASYSADLIKMKMSIEYDKAGNVIRETVSIGDGNKRTTVNTYNKKDQLVKTVYTVVSKETGIGLNYKEVTVYSYDSKGNLIKEASELKYSDGTKTKYSFEYKYDSKGNLVKEIENELSEYGITLKTVTTYSYKKLSKKVFDVTGIRLSGYQYKYDGKAKKPAVFLDDYRKGVDYKVSYENNVKPGKAKAIITFIGDYEGKEPITILFNIKK